MNTVVDRAPGNETLPPPKEISVTRFGRHERFFQTLQQARIFRPSIASRNTPPSPSPLVDLSTHGRIYATILRARNVRGLCLAICLFDYPTEILSHCVSSIFRADFSQFVALTIFSAYFFPSASIFNIHRWNFSTIFLLRSGKYRVIIYTCICILYTRDFEKY